MTEGAANADVVVSMYTPVAADYEEIWAPLLRPYGIRLLDELPLSDARHVLEVGCGVGRLLPDIAERAPRALVVGSDLTEAMLRAAPDEFPRAVMDGTRLGFADGVFDAVVSVFVLFHFPDPPGALQGLRRVLRPGGAVAIAVWGTGQVFPAQDSWSEELDKLEVPPDPAGEGPRDGEEQVNSPEKMRAILAEAGFEDVRAESAAWEQPWDVDGFVHWRTHLGPTRRRVELLDPERRAVVVARARDRVSELPPEDLIDHDEVVLSTARAPA